MRAEMVELMHKFVLWSRVKIFQNKRTRSTQLNPKLMFWCVSLCLGAFGNVSLIVETRCKTVWNGAIKAQVCAIKSHQNFSQLTHPIPLIGIITHVFGAIHSVWVHLGLFRYCTKVDAMRAEMVELMHKFVPWSRVRIFQNERTRSTQLNHKLMFCCVS